MQSDSRNKELSQATSLSGSESKHEILLTRRHFLYGALGVGALALAASKTVTPSLAYADDAQDLSYLSVPESQVFTLDDCTEIPASESVDLIGSYELPYGTLLWTNGDSIAACLLPTEGSKPLTQMGILFLETGNYQVVLDAAVNQDQGFEIYDVRANDKGLVWTEANIFSGVWYIYTADFRGNTLGKPTKVDEGDHEWETPTIAAVGSYAFWQVLPLASGSQSAENSVLRRAEFGSESSEEIYSSEGRMSTPPYPLKNSLVITPRTSTEAIHHQLTLLDAQSAETQDALVLPQGMKPLEAGHGDTGFTFAFDGIYSYGEGIANLGTYTPQTSPENGEYTGLSWFRFNKSPSAPPAWSKGWFIVKSTRTVCGVNLTDKSYFSLDEESGSDSYGDYLASTGVNESFVSYANIHSKSIEGEEKKYCLVRVWTPHSRT